MKRKAVQPKGLLARRRDLLGGNEIESIQQNFKMDFLGNFGPDDMNILFNALMRKATRGDFRAIEYLLKMATGPERTKHEETVVDIAGIMEQLGFGQSEEEEGIDYEEDARIIDPD